MIHVLGSGRVVPGMLNTLKKAMLKRWEDGFCGLNSLEGRAFRKELWWSA
jgi:hypothetical protein